MCNPGYICSAGGGCFVKTAKSLSSIVRSGERMSKAKK